MQKYLSSCRFDLMAKYLYIKYEDKKINTNFYRDLYHNHIITFNNCNELPDSENPNQNPKKNIDDFFESFDKLIYSIKNNGFDNKYPITIGNNGVIINGAHRLMISYFYNIQPTYKLLPGPGNVDYNCNFFLNRKSHPSLDSLYTDTMALEYIKHNPNIRAMVLYPTAYPYNKFRELFHIINQYAYIYYSKSIKLNPNGISNLIKEMYRGEEWIGGMFPVGFSPGGKAQRCVGLQGNKMYPTILLLLDMNELDKCDELKDKCRVLFGIGKHSLHISDYMKDTFRIASSLLNENSIDYLNKGTNDISENTKRMLLQYFENIGENNEDYSIKEILDKISYIKTGDNDELLYNPKNYYYINGCKIHKDIKI